MKNDEKQQKFAEISLLLWKKSSAFFAISATFFPKSSALFPKSSAFFTKYAEESTQIKGNKIKKKVERKSFFPHPKIRFFKKRI